MPASFFQDVVCCCADGREVVVPSFLRAHPSERLGEVSWPKALGEFILEKRPVVTDEGRLRFCEIGGEILEGQELGPDLFQHGAPNLVIIVFSKTGGEKRSKPLPGCIIAGLSKGADCLDACRLIIRTI